MEFLKKLYRFSSSWTGTILIVAFVIFFIAQAFVIPSRSMVSTLYEGDMLFVKKFSYGIPIPRIPWLEIPVLPDFKGNGHIFEGERPKRGDIVVFIPPHIEKTYYVKRNFAIGGDEVIYAYDGFYLRPSEGDLYIKQHFPNIETKQFFGKTFVKNPYMQEHTGIHYALNNLRFQEALSSLVFDGREWKVLGGQGFAMKPMGVDGSAIEPNQTYRGEEIVFYKKIAPDEFFMIGDNRDNSLDSRYWGSVPYSRIIGTPWLIYFSINLGNSVEAQQEAIELGKSENWWKYTVRWNRVFKSVEELESEMREGR
ncbi:signal peptidase I [Helicobacter cholecystus]|uniref:signal peptidase I n=1 Tax=Helicobacter cholecystus TaxID=45498 RepID=UPI0027392C2C|nr:signal peptidase I [Helicobacter cholecystus]